MIYAAYVSNAALTKFILIGFGIDSPEAEMKLETRLKYMAAGTKSKVVSYKEKQDAPEFLPYTEPKLKATAKPKVKPKAKPKSKSTGTKPKKRRKTKRNPKGFEPWKHLWIQTKDNSFVVWNEKQTRKLGTFNTQRGARRFIGNRS